MSLAASQHPTAAGDGESYFVIAARIAAELHFAIRVARDVSLTAKNASAVALRAGDKALGFKPITRFIDELAATTMRQAAQINALAVRISQVAVARERAQHAQAHFQQVYDRAPDAAHLRSVDGAVDRGQQAIAELGRAFTQQRRQLEQSLEETEQHIRAAGVIATRSKVEAINAGEFRQQLIVIAEAIASAATDIQQHLGNARQLLHQL